MNPNAQAKIIDGTTLCFNSTLTAQIAVLMAGPEIGREKLDELARRSGQGDSFDWRDVGTLPLAAPGLDSYLQALDIVRTIGKAVGEEFWRRGTDCEWDVLFQAFRAGLVSMEPPKVRGDGILENLFQECGVLCSGIVGSVLDLKEITREELTAIHENVFDVFTAAVEEEIT